MAEGIRENEREDVSKMIRRIDISGDVPVRKHLRKIANRPPGDLLHLTEMWLPANPAAGYPKSIHRRVILYYRNEEEL
jgi:hypothetical protein